MSVDRIAVPLEPATVIGIAVSAERLWLNVLVKELVKLHPIIPNHSRGVA
jgi:hypothetical protein